MVHESVQEVGGGARAVPSGVDRVHALLGGCGLGRALEIAAVLLPYRDDVGVEDVGVEDGPLLDSEDDIHLSILALDLGDVELDPAQFYED